MVIRFPAKLPVQLMRTFTVLTPPATHWRQATCGEVDCHRYRKGWRVIVDESTDLGQKQAYYIRHDKTRRHTETRLPTGLIEFAFEPGQRCFGADKHKVKVGKPEIFIARDGDWRGNPTGVSRVHTKPEFWVEDCATNLDKVKERMNRG